MRALAVLALLAAGCKDKQPGHSPTAGSGSAGSQTWTHPPAIDAGPPPPVDWAGCDAALIQATTADLHARPRIIIDGCNVCGDWSPILRWSVPTTTGGPTRSNIETAMATCNAFCTGDAKLKFLGTLDDARGSKSRTPWRQLGEICKDKVSAVPDQRFISAPYFALDRIARAAAARGGATAETLAKIGIALPALTVVGTGPELPVVTTGVSPNASSLHITLVGTAVHVGQLPVARLGASGVAVEIGADPYPGRAVPLAQLAAELKKLTGGDPLRSIVLIAPRNGSARALLPLMEARNKTGIPMIFLAAQALESPEGWQLPGAIRVAIEINDQDPIVLTETMTIQQLADELATRASRGVVRVGVKAQ